MHETTWESSRVRGASSSGGDSVGKGPGSAGSRSTDRVFPWVSKPMAGRCSEERTECTPRQACAGPAQPADVTATGAPAADSPQGGHGPGVQYRFVDPAQGCRSHFPDLWDHVSPRSCLEGSSARGMELPETGEASTRAKRGGHSAMAGRALAAYKKKLVGPVEVSSSQMRADSCSSRSAAGLGHHGARPRSFGNGTVGIGFRLSARSPWLHTDDGLASTGRAIATTSALPKFYNSSKCSIATFLMASRSSGTVIARTGQHWFQGGWPVIGALLSSSSRHTPLTSIPRSMSGATPSTVTWPTSPRQTSITSKKKFLRHCSTSGESATSSHRSSEHLNWNYKMFDYLCNGQ